MINIITILLLIILLVVGLFCLFILTDNIIFSCKFSEILADKITEWLTPNKKDKQYDK